MRLLKGARVGSVVVMANRHVTALERDIHLWRFSVIIRANFKTLGLGAYDVRQHRINQPDIQWEKRMKIWQILLMMWVVAGCFMLANHFHRENIERDKKR